ncbi:MAG: ECF transporter S component [Subdoligranulum variabile]|nr:MAG: ECF transporter S component [Subdoligranulum variabile]
MQTKNSIRPLAITAMLSAVGCVLMMLDFPIPMLIPAFVKMDVSELPALLASFSLGPAYGVAVCFVKNILAALFHGSTGGIGEVCNFLIGAAFTAVAGLIYQRHKSRRSAVIASLAGAAVMALVSVPVNYFISYPVYAAMFGGIDAVLGAYQELRPGTDGLLECLLVFNLPFTFVKGLIDAALCFFIYKPLSPILHGRR